MTTSRHPRRRTAPATLPRLRPLAWAVAVLMGPAWGAPGLQEIPVKSDVWIKPGQGAGSYVVNQGLNSVTATVQQVSRRAIYNWKSFNIGANATVNFDMQGGAGSSALNRIHDQNPSQIFGKLNANGEVLLINRNGIIFGKGAQVNVQGLIASTLDINDDVFLGGFTTIDTINPTFEWKDAEGVATYAPEDNFVRVEAGAEITTASGGRVFLMAPKVENAGEITTPGGQTVLAGGEKVWLKSPDKGAIYASEANPKFTATRGLLVEVSGAGSATNLGKILAQKGNITLVGYAVRNAGKLQATTSATSNGSVFLQARRVTETPAANKPVMADQGGQLTLAEGSRIEITPDNSEAYDSNSTFTRSRVHLSGQTISLEQGSAILAQGGMVDVRAEDRPSYTSRSVAFEGAIGDDGADPFIGAGAAPSTTARVVLGKDVVIDVSGTTDTTVGVDRNFVTTELLGATDLKDSPLQKGGALYPGLAQTKLTFDIRDSAAVIGHTKDDAGSSYLLGVKKTAGERLADAGSVVLASTGAVVTHQDSLVNVSGGQVNYTSAVVKPTQLLGADGKVYTANTATKDVLITKVLTKAVTDDTRFGPVTAPGTSLQGRLETGYVEGRAGGELAIFAPKVVATGQVKAGTVAGERQRLGKDKLAIASAIRLGSLKMMNASSANAILQGMTITADAQPLSPDFWDDAIEGEITGGNRVSAATLNASGAGVIEVASEGSITVSDGADLRLADAAQLTLRSRAMAPGDGISLGGNITGRGASVNVSLVPVSVDIQAGSITLKSGKTIDVAGNFVNRQVGGANQQAAWAGGNVTLASAGGLDLQDGSAINVSGGATVSSTGAMVGTRAGAIILESQNAVGSEQPLFGDVHLGATLLGQQMVNTAKSLNDSSRSDAESGKLRIKVGDVRVVAADGGPAIREGLTQDGMTISTDLFSQGGFRNFDLEGVRHLDVAGNAVIDPQVRQWTPKASAAWAASGSAMNAVTTAVVNPQGQRPSVNLSLSSKGHLPNDAANMPDNGSLTLNAGSQIKLGPKSAVNLTGGNELLVNGLVQAAGGKIALDMVGMPNDKDRTVSEKYVGRYQLGSTAVLDVSGTTVLKPSSNGLRQGEVLNGGSISLGLTSGTGSVVTVAQGAKLKANGAIDQLYVSLPSVSGGTVTQRQAVASDGGSISVVAGAGGGVLAGDLQAKAGGAQAMGGTLSVSSTETVRLQTGLVDDQQATEAGVITVSADMVRQGGFADLKLKAREHIELKGAVDLAMRRNLVLDAPVLMAKDAAQSLLKAASVLAWTSTTNGQPAAGEGVGAWLTLQGGLLDLSGQVATDGVSQLTLVGDQEVRLRTLAAGAGGGGLTTAADVVIKSPQLVGSTGSSYTLDASGHALSIEGGRPAAASPLSVGASLAFKAATIDQRGTIQAPFGQITLSATERVTLHEGSVTSVSGDGITAPYGTTTGGQDTWQVNGQTIDRLPEKTITVEAPGQLVELKAGSTLDLSAGGKVVAWEFVAGPNGSKDVFTGSFDTTGTFAVVPTVKGYAPIDAQLLSDTAGVNDLLGFNTARQITFGAGGPLPAGTYTVLPARYALLPGAFLVRPSSKANLAVGQSVTQPIGSTLVGATLSTLGAGPSAAAPATYEVMAQAVARRSSEIREANADTFFAGKAAAADQAAPRGTAQGGTLNLAATRLSLEGRALFKSGGELNISSDKIRVVSDGTAANVAATNHPDALILTADQLNATGAGSLMLGGTRQGQSTTVASGDASGGARQTVVSASDVVIDQDVSLHAGADIILAANGKVLVADGAQIESRGTGASEALAFEGDGALVRVSADSSATSARTNTLREKGEVVLGEGVILKGGAVTVEATQRTEVAGTAKLAGDSLTLGAGRMAVGDGAAQSLADAGDTSTLLLNPTLTAQLSAAKALTLRSFDGIDFIGQAQLGSANQSRLTLDSAALRVLDGPSGQPSVAHVQAGSVSWTNTSGSSAVAAEAGTVGSRLTLSATGQGGADGHVRLGSGTLAMSGAETNRIEAAGSVVVQSRRQAVTNTQDQVVSTTPVVTQLSSTGNLTLQAKSITTRTGDNGEIAAQGALRIERPGDATGKLAATAGSGGRLTLKGQSIEQAGTVELSSGALRLQASGVDGQDAITFGAGSITNLAGRSKVMDGITVATPGGDLSATAAAGHIRLNEGSVIDVSAGTGAAGISAGSVTLSAPTGQVSLDGTIKASAGVGQTGGSLSIDSLEAVDLAKLASRIAAQQTAQQRNFSQALTVRQRAGDMTVGSETTLRAADIKLVSDGGALTVNGQLDASGAQAGSIKLAAKGDVILVGSEGQLAAIKASATQAGAQGGELTIHSDGGSIGLRQDAVVDLSGGAAGQGGQVDLRAVRTAGNEVPIEAIASQMTGVDRITVEGVKVYQQSTINQTFIDKVKSDNTSFIGATGQNASKIVDRLASVNIDLATKLAVRSGAEVRSTGDMTVSADWNLLSFNANGTVKPTGNGQPMNLTLRAQGDLKVQASLSDGFRSSGTSATTAAKVAPLGLITPGEGADLTLVAGADLGSSDVTAIKPVLTGDDAASAKGNVIIGATNKDVLVRTTTGDIAVAASQKVQLLNDRAVVYTTGRVATEAEVGSPVAPPVNALNNGLFIGEGSGFNLVRQGLYLTDAGSVQLTAGSDVESLATGAAQYGTEWWWRAGGTVDEKFDLTWFSRYDKFQQGIASFGGGDVRVQAGGSVRNIGVSSASSGYVNAETGTTTQFAGGAVAIKAADDVEGVFIHAGGASLNVAAGRDIKASPTRAAPQIHYQDTSASIWSRQMLKLGAITEVGSVNSARQNKAKSSFQVVGLAPNASMAVLSSGGDVLLSSELPANGEVIQSTDLGVAHLFPKVTQVAAPEGALQVATLNQASGTGADLSLLAQGALQVDKLRVKVLDSGDTPTVLLVRNDKGGDGPSDLTSVFLQKAFELGSREPVRLLSETGSVSLNEALVSNPVRVVAAKDITAGSVVLQHQSDQELSLIQAGRDVNLITSATGLKTHGPGDVVAAAGRHLNVLAVPGVTALGNRENDLLPEGSANLTLLAGVDLASGQNYGKAAQDHYELLGVAGIGKLSGTAEERRTQALALAAEMGLDGAELRTFVQHRLMLEKAPTLAEALVAFDGMPVEQKLLFINRKLTADVRQAGRAAAVAADQQAKDLAYLPGYQAIDAVFPGLTDGKATANVLMGASQVKTLQNSPITVMAPGGGINVGQLSGSDLSAAPELGIVTTSGGNITTLVRDNIDINQSRIFTVAKGDLLLWSSKGNIDAGRGAKTVTGAPPPVFRLENGQFVVDTSGSFSGSGIAALDEDSALDLFAPRGEINAGDAGIKAVGALFLTAMQIVGVDNIAAGGPSIGVPAAPPVGNAATNVGSLGQSATAAGNDAGENSASKRRNRRQVLLELLGFGGELPDPAAGCRDGVTQEGDCADSVK
ncbi:MAG: filamentous hemagglutinin family protein [Aquabacterium sp.]|uniref:filamentous haemagglutinin family protein n=1 Tax=Aquabacterium sp. TaxID=1872578 RepID=UPI002720E854|nr:filamentous haemagglutinin family protein [Aquabacterium sp.]MDO9002215.1 filamentous hemagglutinin family protein [Aquabacterium sp.]